MNYDDMIYPAADDPSSGYDADCCACLHGRAHSHDEHAERLAQAYEDASEPCDVRCVW